jgi:DNA-binding transcriptional ArsR family regulator
VARAGAHTIDDAFGVISHPLRRELLERLAGGESRVTDLAADLPVSRPAVSQHLRLMLNVGVVVERRQGRDRYYSLHRDRLGEVDSWLARLDNFWACGLRRLGEHLESEHPDSEHPDSEHPDSEHPDSEHPDSEHPDSEHVGSPHVESSQ